MIVTKTSEYSKGVIGKSADLAENVEGKQANA
jgi:hypothetical protein